MDRNDARAVRRASRAVGIQITVASSILVIAVLIAAFSFVFSRIKLSQLLDFHQRHESTIDVGGSDILIAGLIIGAIAIALAGTMSWFATRRAVRPLAQALRLQRAFVADASHELRTPLTVLDARLQLLERGLSPADPSASTVLELRRDSRTLIEIVNDLLAAAEVGAAQEQRSRPVDVGPIVSQAVESMRIIAVEKSISIALRVPHLPEGESIATPVPAGSMNRCLIALLDNAIDFSPPQSTVTVAVTATKAKVTLSVSDEGAGIQGIDPARIFDRFAHSATAHTPGGGTHSGFGIGLSLVRDTIERYGGLATVAATSTSGTTLTIELPRAWPQGAAQRAIS
jgi:two-component system, OmpR family, sensor kinase